MCENIDKGQMLDTKKISVCHISDCHSIEDNRIFRKECTSLAEEEYSVTLIAVGNSDCKNGVTRIGIKKRGVIGRIIKTRTEILKIVRNSSFDIVHLHDPTLLLIVRRLKESDIKVIFDSHEDYYQQIQIKSNIPRIFRTFVAKIFKNYLWIISKYLDGFLYPAENSTIEVQVPITVLGNAPKIEKIPEVTNNTPFVQRKRCICYVGSISEQRGITQLIKAAYKAQCKVILAGNFTNEKYLSYCQNMVEYSVVDYKGFVRNEDLHLIFNEAKIGISALLKIGQYNNSDNLGTKVMEYCSFGLPVILNDKPYNKLMVEKYKFGINVDPSNLDLYAETLNYYLDRDDILEEYGKNGKALVMTKLNWETEYNSLKNLYSIISKDMQ